MVGLNLDKVRQLNINRTMHAEQMDKKANDRKNPVDISNTIVVKKDSRWKKIRKFLSNKKPKK